MRIIIPSQGTVDPNRLRDRLVELERDVDVVPLDERDPLASEIRNHALMGGDDVAVGVICPEMYPKRAFLWRVESFFRDRLTVLLLTEGAYFVRRDWVLSHGGFTTGLFGGWEREDLLNKVEPHFRVVHAPMPMTQEPYEMSDEEKVIRMISGKRFTLRWPSAETTLS